MKFLIDAHLPASLCALLSRFGHDAIHTLELAAKNATKDSIINQISLTDQRIVVSKDTDFFYSHVLHGQPWKLLLVATGNISTSNLKALFERNMPVIEAVLRDHTLVEIDRLTVTPIAKTVGARRPKSS